MPPLPDPPNPTIRADLFWQILGDPLGQTRMFFTYTGSAPGGSDCSTLATDICAAAGSAFAGLYQAHTTLDACKVTDITTPTGADAVAGTPVVGTRTGTMVPAGSAVLVNHSISTRYRGGKPRTYLPFGVSADLQNSGLWTTAFASDVDTAWGSFIAAVLALHAGSTTIQSYIALSYYSGVNAPVTLPSGRVKQSSKVRAVPVQYAITGHSTNTIVASQRRRNRDA